MPETDNSHDVSKLISDIRHGKLYNSYDVTIRTEELVEKLIAGNDWSTAQELMELLKSKMQKLANSLPQEATPVNIMRHVLKIIREEYAISYKNKGDTSQSLHHLVTASPGTDSADYSKHLPTLRASLLDNLAEYKVELESSADNIASQAKEHIHSQEIILTFGRSNTVERFLKSAAKTRRFQVIIVEDAPLYDGHTMASSLAKSGLQTTVISDASIFAIMSRVNKVIIGTHTVLANGGLRAACGIHTVALAAKHYSVPVMVLVHMYKLSPIHLCSHEQDAFNVCASPATILPYQNGPIVSKVHVYNPVFDYVPPELVTLFISHQGGNSTSYVYRMLSELYHQDDYDL